jgi:F0F1-type ATP synthase membrane subunit b/b'
VSNGIDKKALFKLKSEPYLKPISDLGVGFYNLDENTAILRFQLSNSKGPLLIHENNLTAYAYFESSNGSASDVVELNVEDSFNGIVTITLDKDFLQASTSTKVTGQVYIGVNNVDGKEEYNEVAVFREFTFQVADALINKVSSFTKIEYIRMFDQLKAHIEQRVNDIEQAIANGDDYVAEMKTAKEQGIAQINQTVTDSKSYIDDVIAQAQTSIDETSSNAISDVETSKSDAINTITNKVSEGNSSIENVANNATTHVDEKLTEFNQAIEDNEFVQPEMLDSKLSELQWQKHKLTTDDGYIIDVNVNNSEDTYNNLPAGIYYTTMTPSPSGISSSGYTLVLFRNEDHINTPVKKIFYSPYNSSRIFHKRSYRTTWFDWEEVSNSQTDTGWVPLQLINGVQAYSSAHTPQYKLINNNGDITLKLRGAVKNITSTPTIIAYLPSNITSSLVMSNFFVQNCSVKNGSASIARWVIPTTGEIKVEYINFSSDLMASSDMYAINTVISL